MGVYKENIPKADMLMGSMRSMGYSFESAIADIVDNSISAGCSSVNLFFPTDSFQRQAVGILDDGCGLSNDALFNAMCYGSSASEDIRSENDLGRFGLGLKAASLSQCRVLTVASKIDNKICAYSWDYNYILREKKWYVKELSEEDIEKLPYFSELNNKATRSATLVVWEDFDVLDKSSNGQVHSMLTGFKDRVYDHVALIFHRYIATKKLTIHVNNSKVKAQDPFLEENPKTTRKRERTIALRDSIGLERQIKVKPFVLPFATDLTDKDKKLLGGADSLRTKQGFYIYRNQRLIIWGTWFGLKRSELTKNARIRVDIPNTLDDIWCIDIKKQNALIPKAIQNQLKQTVIEAMGISVRQQTHRGRKESSDDNINRIWDRMQGRNEFFYYQVNRESLIYKYVMDRVSGEDADAIELLLSEIEKNIPIQQIYIDRCNEVVSIDNRIEELGDTFQIGITLIDKAMASFERNALDVIEEIMKSEPFCYYQELNQMLLNHYTYDSK